MAMYRIICPSCGWKTKPHFSIIDCVREKETAHAGGIKEFDRNNGIYFDAHNSAFGNVCPKCGRTTAEEHRWFSDAELKETRGNG